MLSCAYRPDGFLKLPSFIYLFSCLCLITSSPAQYFVGSDMAWSQEQNVGARNLLPLEITQRVVRMIGGGDGGGGRKIKGKVRDGREGMELSDKE